MDQFLNIKLENISVVNELKYPHLVGSFPIPGYSTWRRGWLFEEVELWRATVGEEEMEAVFGIGQARWNGYIGEILVIWMKANIWQ